MTEVQYRLEPDRTDDDFFTNTLREEAIHNVREKALGLYIKKAIENARKDDKRESKMRKTCDHMSDEEKCFQQVMERGLEDIKKIKADNPCLNSILCISNTEFPLTPQHLAIFEHILGDRFTGIAITVHRPDFFPASSEGKLIITCYSLSPNKYSEDNDKRKGIRFDYLVTPGNITEPLHPQPILSH